MAYAPDPPFPKEEGDAIRSADWNELVEEVQRLDAEKVGEAGGTVDGNLLVQGSIGIGTAAPQDRLDVHGAICFESDTNRRVFGATRGGRDAVVVDGHFDELEIKGRVVDWTGGDFFLGLDNPHANAGVHIGRQCRAVTLYSGGGAAATLTATSTRVGIGTTGPATTLHVVGDQIRLQKIGSSQQLNMSMHGHSVDFYGSGADLYINNTGEGHMTRIRNLVNICSREHKEDIHPLVTKAADVLLDGLNPVSFRDRGRREEERLGFVAEDAPGGVATADGKAVDQMAITAILTSVLQQQKRLIEALQKELAALRTEVHKLAPQD